MNNYRIWTLRDLRQLENNGDGNAALTPFLRYVAMEPGSRRVRGFINDQDEYQWMLEPEREPKIGILDNAPIRYYILK